MIGYVITAGLFTAFSTFKVVCGIDGFASRASIVSSDFLEPKFIPDRLDAFKIDPEFDSMRHCRLKLFQVITGILFTFAAKVDAPFCRTSEHSAFFTVKQPFSGPTSITLALFH